MESEMKILKGASGFVWVRDFWLSAKIMEFPPDADVTPKWDYIPTPSADMNKLAAMQSSKFKPQTRRISMRTFFLRSLGLPLFLSLFSSCGTFPPRGIRVHYYEYADAKNDFLSDSSLIQGSALPIQEKNSAFKGLRNYWDTWSTMDNHITKLKASISDNLSTNAKYDLLGRWGNGLLLLGTTVLSMSNTSKATKYFAGATLSLKLIDEISHKEYAEKRLKVCEEQLNHAFEISKMISQLREPMNQMVWSTDSTKAKQAMSTWLTKTYAFSDSVAALLKLPPTRQPFQSE
jgi:hypothetical protein